MKKVSYKELLNLLLKQTKTPAKIIFCEDKNGSNIHAITFFFSDVFDSWYVMLDYIGGDRPAILRTDLYNDFDEYEEEIIENHIKAYFNYRNLKDVYIKQIGG